MTSRALHILTPLGNQTPASLVEENILSTGDLIADFRQFPFAAYELQDDQTYPNITGRLIAVVEYEAVIREWLIQFTIQTGLQDILVVQGHGLWWTQNSLKFRPSISDLGNSFAWIDLMIEINRQYRPISIVVYGPYEPIIHLVKQIYHEVPLKVWSETSSQTWGVSQPTWKPALLIIRTLLGCLYFIYAMFRHPDICFLSATTYLRTVAVGSKRKLRDIYLDDIAEALEARGWRTAMLETLYWNASWKGLVARSFFFPNDVVFILSSPRLHKLGIHRSIVRKWRNKWIDIQPRLLPYLQYQGYDISPIALPMLEREFTHLAPYFEVMTQVWTIIFRIWRPKLLFVNCFYMLSSVAAIIAARSLNIPTIEQQHGVIGNNHLPYLIPAQLKTNARHPLCDKMIVWGDYTKRLLLNTGVYKPADIAICGFPRIDALLLGTLPPKPQTLTEIGIPPDAQVALYSSGVVGRNLWSVILDGIKNSADTTDLYWIIKLHPRDKTRRNWEATIKQRQIQRVIVVEGEFDFYALLAACDVHISFISTTLIESAILGKPNLGLTIPYVSDPVGYADANAFLPVTPDQLGSTVCNLLTAPSQIEALLDEQKRFADDWCVHDGKAIERIVHLVETTLGM